MTHSARIEGKIGLGLLAAFLLVERFVPAPAFVAGLLLGLALVFLAVSLLPGKAYDRLRRPKGRRESQQE